MAKNLVLVGGGHAHLRAIANIDRFVDRNHRVTLVAPAPEHYYSGMGPGMIGGFYQPEETRFPIKIMAERQGGDFVEDSVTLVHPEKKRLFCKTGRTMPYDIVSFNTGSVIPTGIILEPHANILPVKPIANLHEGRIRILDLLQKKVPRIVIVGGGPAGVEISGNIARLIGDKNKAEITLMAGRRLLSRLPVKARKIAAKSLLSRGVKIVVGQKTKRVEKDLIYLQDGSRIPYDLCFMAVGIRPSDLFAKSGLPTGEDGGLSVNGFLQSIQYPQIFGGGDCIDFTPHALERVGVYAVRQNGVLCRNLFAALEERALKTFNPGRSYFLILNLGDGRGLFWWNSWVWQGKLAFFIKNLIDRKFMRKFLN